MQNQATTPTGYPGASNVIIFPTDRLRSPGADSELYDPSTFTRCLFASKVAYQFDHDKVDEQIRMLLLCENGVGGVARMLEHNKQAISFLRAATATLVAADARISAAAARVVAEASL